MGNRVVFEKATDALKNDHRVIEKVLAVLEKLTESSGEASLETWRRAIDFIRNFADKCHHLKEEKVFFPALEEHGIPRGGGPIGMMLMEHEEGRGFVRAITDCLQDLEKGASAERTVLIEKAGAYLRLLREHIQKEDQILFPMADEALSTEAQRRLLQQFEEHEAREIGAGVHEKYLKLAQELEGSVK